MTKLLLRLFVKDYHDPTQAQVRSGIGKLIHFLHRTEGLRKQDFSFRILTKRIS